MTKWIVQAYISGSFSWNCMKLCTFWVKSKNSPLHQTSLCLLISSRKPKEGYRRVCIFWNSHTFSSWRLVDNDDINSGLSFKTFSNPDPGVWNLLKSLIWSDLDQIIVCYVSQILVFSWCIWVFGLGLYWNSVFLDLES